MPGRIVVGAALVLAFGLGRAAPVAAQEVDPAAHTQFVLDNIWVFVAGVLVFLMQAGFAMVEAGLTRAKSVANIMAKNLADMMIGVVAFFAIGFTLAYSGDGWLVGDLDDLFLSSTADPAAIFGTGEGLTPATNFFFQVVFAATAVTIASGAMAERTRFSAYLIFSLAMTAVIYPVVVHWTWGGGLIADISVGEAVFSDFAGSSVVHSVGGWAALTGAVVLGPRLGKYGPDGRARAIPGHSMPFAVIGVLILWFGWFGFNPGSELAADAVVPFVALNTMLAAAAGGLGAAAIIWHRSGKPDVAMAANGVLAGLVSITAPTATVEPWAALLIGCLGGALVVVAVLAIDRLGVDDPVGAIAVHGMCGVWGTLCIGLFARYDDGFLGRENAGLLYGGGLDQLAVQVLMVVIVAVWTLGTTYLLFRTMAATIGLRVTPEEELAGLDVSEHGSHGYGAEPAGAVVA